jgi:hypothetical protein
MNSANRIDFFTELDCSRTGIRHVWHGRAKRNFCRAGCVSRSGIRGWGCVLSSYRRLRRAAARSLTEAKGSAPSARLQNRA